MLSLLIYPLFACFSSNILAKPFQATNDQLLQSDLGDPSRSSQPSGTLPPSDGTLSLFNTSVSTDGSIDCDGGKYGFELDIDDCIGVLRYQLSGSEKIRFGHRGTISSEKYFALPYRLMGDRAHCYVEPVLLNGATFGTASLSQIREATSDLVLSCASRHRQGGIATHFSADGNIALILSTYKPGVDCRGNFPAWDSCLNVVAEMPVSKEPLLFGPETDPKAQVLVPHFIESDNRKCLGRIWYTKKESDTASWFEMWEAVTAVYSACVRNKKKGSIKGLGNHGNLFLTMTPQIALSGNISLNDTTYIKDDQGVSEF